MESDDGKVLKRALDIISSKNPEHQEERHDEFSKVATDIHDSETVRRLRDLINSDFARCAIIPDEKFVKGPFRSDPLKANRGRVRADGTVEIQPYRPNRTYDATEADEQEGNTEKRKLSPESPKAKELLGKLETRFKANMHLHYCISWNNVKTSLERSPEALWSLAQMESAGHDPDVYHYDESDYYFGTCSKESPESARNCVYDKEAADWLKENCPDEKFNGSAVEMAEAMGIKLMHPEHYEDILQEKGRFDEETLSWLLTQSDVRSSGYALFGNRVGVVVFVSLDPANLSADRMAWLAKGQKSYRLGFEL